MGPKMRTPFFSPFFKTRQLFFKKLKNVKNVENLAKTCIETIPICPGWLRSQFQTFPKSDKPWKNVKNREKCDFWGSLEPSLPWHRIFVSRTSFFKKFQFLKKWNFWKNRFFQFFQFFRFFQFFQKNWKNVIFCKKCSKNAKGACYM